MGLPGRTSLARILLLSVVLSGLPLAAAAAEPTRAQAHGTKAAAATPTARRAPARHVRRDGFVPGRVLVRFAARAGEPDRRAAVATVDGTVMAGSGRTRVVRLERGADVRAAARRLADRPGVASAEPDWLRRVDDCDPDVCWHLQPTQGAEHGANVVAAHDDGAIGTGQTVAVVDTGVVTGVADLAGRVAARWRCRDICEPAVATPTSSHGTEVASVVAALDNTTGTTGVAPGATVASYRVDSSGGGIPISYLRQALLHIAADDVIDVVNLSLGGSQWSAAEQEGIDAVLAAGKTVVASAGNTGDRIPQYPAAFPGVISVGATDDGGQIAGFSSTARSTWSPPATAWPWPRSPASSRTAAAPATTSRAWPSTAAPRSRPRSSPGCWPWPTAAARWWPASPWRRPPTPATRAATTTPRRGPTGWSTPPPSSMPTTPAPRPGLSWK
jgi:hypothetical protein